MSPITFMAAAISRRDVKATLYGVNAKGAEFREATTRARHSVQARPSASACLRPLIAPLLSVSLDAFPPLDAFRLTSHSGSSRYADSMVRCAIIGVSLSLCNLSFTTHLRADPPEERLIVDHKPTPAEGAPLANKSEEKQTNDRQQVQQSIAAASGVNQLGLEVHRQLASADKNSCTCPYGLEVALAVVLAGAGEETKNEMADVLHVPGADSERHASFAALSQVLEIERARTEEIAKESRSVGGPSHAIELKLANRLFAQKDFKLRPDFFRLAEVSYGTQLVPLDLVGNPTGAAHEINSWIRDATTGRINNLVAPSDFNGNSRLVVANAVYLKAPWQTEFEASSTRPEPFHLSQGRSVDVPMMTETTYLPYKKFKDFAAVALPYVGGNLRFLVIVPNKVNGLKKLEADITPAILSACASMPFRRVSLHLPKFKIEGSPVDMSQPLQKLGMKKAFDVPPGSANFDGIAERTENQYLAISGVVQQAFISIDEKGTTASAATVVRMDMRATARREPEPILLTVDRPFFFAVQYAPNGACLFMGRVNDLISAERVEEQDRLERGEAMKVQEHREAEKKAEKAAGESDSRQLEEIQARLLARKESRRPQKAAFEKEEGEDNQQLEKILKEGNARREAGAVDAEDEARQQIRKIEERRQTRRRQERAWEAEDEEDREQSRIISKRQDKRLEERYQERRREEERFRER